MDVISPLYSYYRATPLLIELIFITVLPLPIHYQWIQSVQTLLPLVVMIPVD